MPGRLQDTPLACPISTVDVQGSVLGAAVDLSALPYFLRMFPGPYRAGVPGRLVPISSDRASRRRVVSRVWRTPGWRRESELEVVLWPGPSVGEGGDRCGSSGRIGGPESEVGAVPPRLGLPVGDWIALLAYRSDTWAVP